MFKVYFFVGIPTCRSKISAPLAIAILTASKLSGFSWAEYPIVKFGYRCCKSSIWFKFKCFGAVGYSPTQCMRANFFRRCSKKTTTWSISSKLAPAVEAIIGISVSAIFSRSGQSVKEQLAILMISNLCSIILSTEFSSKGVHIER